jgi:hypothetical protein
MLLRAHSSTNRRKGGGQRDHTVSGLGIVLFQFSDKIGDMYANGTTADARRVFAVKTSLCFV